MLTITKPSMALLTKPHNHPGGSFPFADTAA